MQFNLQHLRVFCAVIEHGGFSRAAKSLHISQPAISKTVRELEVHVGLPLLERGSRNVRPTEAGRALHDRARAIFVLEREAGEEMQAQKGLERGTLRIGASTTIATYWLPPMLAAFAQSHPGVMLHLTSANTRDIARLLLEYELDVALVEGPVEHPRLQSSLWHDDELVLVSAPSHPLAARKRLGKNDLQNVDMVVREPGSGTRAVTETALREAGIHWRAVLEAGSTEAIKQTVAAGLGVAVVSRVAALDQIALGRLKVLCVCGLNLQRPLHRLALKDRPVSAAAQRLIALLQASLF